MKPSEDGNCRPPSPSQPFHSSTSLASHHSHQSNHSDQQTLSQELSNLINNNAMDEMHKVLLQRHHEMLVNSLDVTQLYPTLHAHKILTMDEVTAINQQMSPAARAHALLKLLPEKGTHAFQAFCKSLETNYPHLLDNLFINNSTTKDLSSSTSMSTSLTSDSEDDTLNAAHPSDPGENVRCVLESSRSSGSGSSSSSQLLSQHNYELQQTNQALLHTELKLVTADRDALRNELFKAKSKLNSYKSLVINGVEMKPSDKTHHSTLDYDWLKTQCERAMSELQALKRQHGETVKKCDHAVKEADYYRKKYKETCDKVEHCSNEVLSWKSQYDDLALVKARLQQEVSDLQTLHDNDLSQIGELRRQQRDVINESGSSEILNRMYDTAIDRNDLLRSDYDNMRKRYADLSALHSLTLNKIEVLQDEIHAVKKQLDDVYVERNGLKQQCTSFIRNWDNALRECNELKDTLQRVTQQKDSYLKEMNEVCAVRLKATKDLARVTEERNAAVKEYSLIMSERDTVHMEIDQLQEKLGQMDKKALSWERERKLMSDELETLRREVMSALSDRDRALKEYHELRAGYGDIVSEREEVKKERDEVIKDYRILAQERDVARQERHEALEHRDQILRETYQKVRLELLEEKDQVSKEADSLRREMEKLRKELADTQQEVDVSKRRRDWAFSERDKIVLERESMRTLCDNLRHERDRAVTELAESLRDSDDLKKQKNDTVKELKDLREKYEALMEGKKWYPRISHNHSDDSAIDTDLPEWIVDTQQITVESDDGINYGFDIVCGRDMAPTAHDNAVYISAVIKGSNADGKLRCNDQLVQVNAVDVVNLDKSRVHDLIYKNSRQVVLLVRRKVAAFRSVQYVQLATVDCVDSAIHLDMGFYVTRIHPGSQAVRDGAIAMGDRVVSVNGSGVDGRSLSDISRLLADGGRDGVVLGVVKHYRTPQSSAASSKHNLVESPMIEANPILPLHSQSSYAKKSSALSPYKSITLSDQSHFKSSSPVEKSLKSSGSQTETVSSADHARGKPVRDTKHSYDTILDRAYEKIIGKFTKRHDKDDGKTQKSAGNISCEKVLHEFDSVLDSYDGEKLVVDSGTWPKYQSAVSNDNAPGTVILKPKLKERAPLHFAVEDRARACDVRPRHEPDGAERSMAPRRSDQRERAAPGRPLSEVFERKQDSRARSSFDQKQAPLPPERGDASFAASVRHSPRSSFNKFSAKSSPYLSSLAKSEHGADAAPANKTFSDRTLNDHANAGGHAAKRDHVTKSSNYVSRQHDEHVTRSHEVEAAVISAQRDRDIMARYNRKRPKSAPSRRHERRGVRRTQQDGVKPTNINIHSVYSPPAVFADVVLTSPSSDAASSVAAMASDYGGHTSPSSFGEVASMDGLCSAGSSRYSTLTRESANAFHSSPAVHGMFVVDAPPQYSPPPSYLSHMESVVGSSLSDCESAPPPYHKRHDHYRYSAASPSRSRSSVPSPVPSLQGPACLRPILIGLDSHPYPPSTREEMSYPIVHQQQAHAKSSQNMDGCSTFPKRRNERIRIPSKSSIGQMSTSSIDGDSCSLVYDLNSQSSTSSLPRLHSNYRPRNGETMNIHIEKSSEPLGIQIRRANSGGIFVSQVNSNSLASRAGIAVGHQLLEVCGLNMRTATYQQAANILRQCGNSITMLAQYNPSRFEEVDDDWASSAQTSCATSRQSSAANSPAMARKATVTSHRTSQESINSVTPTNSPQLLPKRPSSRRQIYSSADVRRVTLKRPTETAPLGIGLVGGNAVGIYVNDVKNDSVAAGKDGLTCGDRILEINGIDVRACTAEQAAYELSRPSLTVTVKAQQAYNDFVRVKDEPGDAFYVRALFDRVAENECELSFKQGDILYVDNTVCNGEIGLWKAWLVDDIGSKMMGGTILGRTRLEEDTELLHSISEATIDGESFKSRRGSGSFRRSFFRRRRHQRNNSKDSRDLTCSDASINSDSSAPFLADYIKPTFYCVQRIEPILARPVMIVGPHADALISKLTSESPDKFCRAEIEQVRASMSAIDRYQSDDMILEVRKKDTCFECISVLAVSEITKKNRHCLLDVHPSAIEKLHRYQLYPIVIYIRHKSAKQIREAKDTRFLPEKVSSKSAKEFFEHFQRIEQDFKHLFSANVTGGNMAVMCMQIKSTIDAEQRKIIWINSPANI